MSKPNKYRLFSDVTSVSRGDRIALRTAGYLNADDTVVSWSRLAPSITNRTITQPQAKGLILLELGQPHPREDLIRRLTSYISYSGKEQTMKAIEKILKK